MNKSKGPTGHLSFAFFLVITLLVGGSPTASFAQDYLWPTDASNHLTSAFGEYRGRRFHMGLDIKTWGRTGYKVFAIRPGYVWQISVSPYGYGKVLYLKLDTGEVAVFAHLSKFSEKIQAVVETEQKRLGKYRITKYLKPGQIPVAQGEVIAYTGQTGIGAPHLHFEIRDAANRPTNPLAKGYLVPDDVPPIVSRLSFTPLDAESQVNGDFKPVILNPRWIRSGQYLLNEAVSLWGKVGIAVSSFDTGSNGADRYGVYSLRLYVDDILTFQYKYDRLTFQNNRFIQWERDYRLARRGRGRFYKLYKDEHNELSIYHPDQDWAGALKSISLTAAPDLYSKTQAAEPSSGFTGKANTLMPGPHRFTIEIADFFGNTTMVHGEIHVGSTFDIHPVIAKQEGFFLNDIYAHDLRQIDDVNAFYLQGQQWRPLVFDWSSAASDKGGDEPVEQYDAVEENGRETSTLNYPLRASFLKFVAYDQFGTASYPFIFVRPDIARRTGNPAVSVEMDYYDDYVRLQLDSRSMLKKSPRLVVNRHRADSLVVNVYRKNLNDYIARINLNDLPANENMMTIETENLNGERLTTTEPLEFTRVLPGVAQQVSSKDGECRVNFWLSSLYQPIYVRMAKDTLSVKKYRNIAGHIYSIEPGDVPFNSGAIVHLRYPDDEPDPQKLGVCYQTGKGSWVFIDNEVDTTDKTVWAKVLSLETFALFRDEVPPEIFQIYPWNGAHITDSTPEVSFHIRDRFSGIRSEASIVLRLDGKKLIAEYDPERQRVMYQVEEPLAKGRHEIAIWAQDKTQNVATKQATFWID